MIDTYALEEVNERILVPLGWTDGVRWLKRGIVAGTVPGKRLSRNVFVMTDKHIDKWLNSDDAPVTKPQTPAESSSDSVVGFVHGLSARSSRRVKMPVQESA